MNKKFQNLKKFKTIILGIFVIVAVVVGFHSFTRKVSAALNIPIPLHGWLWSDMPDGSDQTINPTDQEGGRGFGWISVNGTDTGVSGNYVVTLETSDGVMHGYAWSENGGWLDFQPSGPYPTSGNLNLYPTTSVVVDPACLAAATSTSCAVTGWARFVAGEDTNTQDTGGWDGWVNMHSSIANTWGVTYDAKTGDANYGKFSGYAWGGEVAGWIDFSRVSITPPVVNPLDCNDPNATNYGGLLPCTYPAGLCAIPTATNVGQPLPCVFPTGYCSDPAATNYGQQGACIYSNANTASAQLNASSTCPTDGTNGTATLTWSSVGTTSCTASQSNSSSSVGTFSTNGATSGTVTISGIPANGIPSNFSITCSASPGNSPVTVTASNSAMCQVVIPPCTGSNCGGSGTTGIPQPVYKEN